MVDVADDADRAALISVFLQCAELLGGGEALTLWRWGRLLGHIALIAATAVDVVDASCLEKR